jgi:hypothetical protein
MQQESNKILFLGLLFLGLTAAFTASAQAICPICVIAIGAGLGLSRWLKIDDLVSSVWIGAFLWTLVVWTLHWMRKKNWGFKFDGIVTFLFYYLLTFIGLYYMKFVGIFGNAVFGIDKVILGTIAGTIVLWASLVFHNFLKTKNNNKSFFPYQRVAVPVLALILTSLIFYALLTWRII